MISRPDSVFLGDEPSPVANQLPPFNTRKDHLRIPEEPDYQITAESPVDRFGPRLRRWPTTSTMRRPSAPQVQWGGSTQCYSPIDGVQPNFKTLTSSDVIDSYSDPQIYDDLRENVPQLRVEGEIYSVEERTSQEQQEEQQQQQPQHQQQYPQPQLRQTEPASQSDKTHELPTEPRHCYHDSMSSEESFELSTAYSRSRTPRLPSIELKTEEKVPYRHPPAWKVNLIMLALALTTFCTGWDNTMIATAIPRITDQFNSLTDIEWYGGAYLLANCSVQLIYGKLYHLHSIKWVYLAALCIFQVGSFISAIAPSSAVLIIGRAIAGLGASGLLSGSILIIRQLVRFNQRPMYMAGLASVSGVACLSGPIIGGAFTEYVSWRWCFYINLPFGFVACILLLVLYKPIQLPSSRRISFRNSLRFLDLEGTALLIPAIVSLLLALQWGGAKYAWGSVQVIVLFIVCGITLVGFVFVQTWKQELATIPPRVIRSRNVSAGFVFTFCFGAAVVVTTYYVPLWLQVIRNASAKDSGAMIYPLIVSMVVTSLVIAYLVTVIGYYTPFMILASILMSVGGGLLSTLDKNSSSAQSIGYQIIFGIGVGCGIQQSMVAIQAAVKGTGSRNSSSSTRSSNSSTGNGSAVPMGTAIMTFAQTLGGAVFLAVAQSVFDNKLSSGIEAANIPGLSASVIFDTGATELRNAVASDHLNTILQAYNAAIDDTFLVAALVAAISILGALGMEWISIRQR